MKTRLDSTTERAVNSTMAENPSWAVRWLMDSGKSVSEIGALAADILQDVYDGIYHIEDIHRVSFAGRYVEVPLGHALSTYDSNLLTRLVVLAHDRCVRVEIKAEIRTGSYEGNPYEYPALVLLFHKRERGGDWYHGHPTMEEAIATVRAGHKTDGSGAREATE